MSLQDLRTTTADRVGYLLEHLGSVVDRQSGQALREQLGIGMAQYNVLRVIEHSPGISQREVADLLGHTEAGISRQVKILSDKAMITVRPAAERRRRELTLAPLGLKLAQAARELLSKQRAASLSPLNRKQQDALVELLDKLHLELCAPGKPAACHQPYNLLDAYSIQQDKQLLI